VTNLPAAPVGVSAWPIAGGGVRVVWAYPASGATGFNVYVGIGTPAYGSPAAVVPWSVRSLQVDLTGLADATTYAVGVRAYNATGEEANTTTTTATTVASGPSAVVGLTVSTDPADW
jgi:hypothetical protein